MFFSVCIVLPFGVLSNSFDSTHFKEKMSRVHASMSVNIESVAKLKSEEKENNLRCDPFVSNLQIFLVE